MANLVQIGQSVTRNLDDLNSNFFSPTLDIQPSIQDGYKLIVALTESIETHADINFVSGKVYYDFSSSISDYLRIFGIFNNNTQRWMQPTSFLELFRLRDNWELADGDPYLFLPIDAKTTAIFPAMSTAAGSMTILYKARADVLTANSVPQIPIEHQSVLEWYATDDLLDQAQEWQKAMEYFQMWDKGIEDIRKSLRDRSSPNHLYFKHSQL